MKVIVVVYAHKIFTAIDLFYNDASKLSTCIFDINRFELTKDYKTLSNSFVKYTSSFINFKFLFLNSAPFNKPVSIKI